MKQLSIQNTNDDAQNLANDFVKAYPTLFSTPMDERKITDTIAAVLRLHEKNCIDNIKKQLEALRIKSK